jgi:hypothetical protein
MVGRVWPANRREEIDVTDVDAPDPDLTGVLDDVVASVNAETTTRERGFRGSAEIESSRAAWRTELGRVGGPSPLLHLVDDSTARIELSTTHPGGLARFITGQATLLSQLIRDEMSLRAARIAADRIAAKSLELAAARGIDVVQLGIGLAEWEHEGEEFTAPVLLRPLAIRRHGRDFEIRLRGAAQLNPALATALHRQFGIRLDPAAFVALTDADGSFKPNAVIDQLRALTGHLADFSVSPRLLVAPFAEVAPALVADAAPLDHPLLDALAGSSAAGWAMEQGYLAVEAVDPDHRDPSTDLLLLDADGEQEHIVAQVAAGNSVVVKTMPGTGATQTAVNAIGALVSQNKRVLVVGPRRASLRGIGQRFGDIGLPGLAVSPGTLRRDIVRTISRHERAAAPQLTEVDQALVRLRGVLLDYRGALSRPDEALGVSVFDCVTELSRLALLPVPPTTSARLDRATVERIAGDRASIARTMVEAAHLGQFRYGPDDSPWFGARFASGEAAQQAHALAQRLAHTEMPRLLARAQDLIGSTRMRPFETIGELGVYLRLLSDIRDTLDRFLPSVFDRSVSELIIATSSKRDHPEMSAGDRRRLRKLAREYVRPGMHVGDLHEALTHVQQQRILWQRFVAAGVVPEVPTGISDVAVAWQQVAADLASLDAPLRHTAREQQLENLPLPRLGALLASLAEPSDVLQNLQERSELMSRLRDLDPLLTDLAARHVPEEQVAAELELSWWRSALDALLQADRALLGAKADVLERLEADFRLVDEAHAAGSAQTLGWQLAENWRIGLVDWPEEATALKDLLRTDRVTAASLQQQAPHLARTVAPVWLVTPYEIDRISDSMPFDTVVLLDAGATTIAENVGAIRRARQVVAFGDPVTQTPAPFELRLLPAETVAPEPDARTLDELHGRSALAQLGGILPVLSLTRSYRAGGEDLADLVNRRFYGGRIDALPWAGSFLGHGSLVLDYVQDGTGMPDPATGGVESVDAEVERVLALVEEHATARPQETLMVVTASDKHAVRVFQAVLSAMAGRPALTDFVMRDGAEPFTVLPIDRAAAESRDRVIFSLGYGRTPHGRVLSDFGALGRPGGERLLAVAMTRARRSMVIVTCFRSADVEDGRIRHGAVALAEILDEVAARRAEPPIPDDSDPMLVDLSRRLEARGLRTALGHRGKLGLVAANGGMCFVVETDQALFGRSLRESIRLRPEVLRRLGWHYSRVHAFELFADPDAVADRIALAAGLAGGLLTQEIPVVTGG